MPNGRPIIMQVQDKNNRNLHALHEAYDSETKQYIVLNNDRPTGPEKRLISSADTEISVEQKMKLYFQILYKILIWIKDFAALLNHNHHPDLGQSFYALNC